ncbi:MAG TPA: S46 family peptidase [Bacteroidales bacterium]|nr:S46 family peptidase [Bacteroidales bacterium]
MKKCFSMILGLSLLMNFAVKADEGMWLLPLIKKLNIDTMHSLGFRLTAEDIYSINHSSLKDAVVIFGGGCTGEIVSDEGLILTNHHCGYDAIQNHSTVEHNYLEDGFWAMNHKEELPNEDLSVTFLVKVEDITDLVLKATSGVTSEKERDDKVQAVSDSIVKSATRETDYDADVESLFGGNNYYLFVYQTYKDVRLVGAPPSSIGKFGGDTDNWMWPRHTGDFSVFRVYSAPDGKPAAYSDKNIPLKPKYSLPVSLKERKLNDFSMVMGYPGTTTRYMTSYEIKELMNLTNDNRIKIRGLRLDILMKDMRADEKVNIQYASKYYTSSNYYKYSIGQNQGLQRLHIMEDKQNQEKEFTAWISKDPQRTEKYGQALNLIKDAVDKRASYKHAVQYVYESLLTSSELIAFANRATGLYNALVAEPANTSLVDSLSKLLRTRYDDFSKEYNPSTDMKVIPAMLRLYKENVSEEFLPDMYKVIASRYKNDYNKYTIDMFSKSIFANKDKLDAFLKKPTRQVLEKDPAFKAAQSVMAVYRKAYYGQNASSDDFNKGHRLYIAGILEMHPDKKYYPDANFTMRMTYGTIQDYNARDAVHYDYMTTLNGIMEKEDPENPEFVVPAKLKELYKNQDYGEYGKNNIMPVCFISNNDITGGNSGSPVIDGEGALIGLAFDGNWEAMSSNIAFEPALQRCICVDIRYVLFIIDKYAGAGHLIKEMKIIRD